MATEPFLINPPRKRVFPRTLQTKKRSRNRLSPNPLGEVLMIVGANPISRRTKMLENAWFGHPVEHRRAALKGWRKRKSAFPARRRRKKAVSAAPVRRRRRVVRRATAGVRRRRKIGVRRRRSVRSAPLLYTGATPFRYANNPRRRRRSRRKLSSNPRRSHRMRRNPVNLGGLFGSFKHALPLAVTGGAAIIVTNLAPSFAARFVGTSNIAKYGVQVATAVIGGMGVSKFVGREHGTIWTVSGLAVIVADLAQKYVLGRFLPAIAGFGEYDYEMGPGVYGVNAFPEAMSAYPEESVQGFGSSFGENSDPYSTTTSPY